MGALSPHFTAAEFACPHCRVSKALPALVLGLERLRTLGYSSGLVVRSGYRCPVHNKAVGGAANSQHRYGSAADVDLRVSLASVVALGVFSGVGWQTAAGGRRLVRHVDVRHASGHNTTGGTPAHPTTWEYGPGGVWH
jgi:uncharacterized protein YcbK (DUF882 family)